MIVMKFGGSSLATAARIQQVGDLVVRAAKTPCVVLSAMGDSTNQLFAIAEAAGAGNHEDAINRVGKLFASTAVVIDELLQSPNVVAAPIAQLRADVELLVRAIGRDATQSVSRERIARTRDALVAHGERIATLLLTEHLRELGQQ